MHSKDVERERALQTQDWTETVGPLLLPRTPPTTPRKMEVQIVLGKRTSERKNVRKKRRLLSCLLTDFYP